MDDMFMRSRILLGDAGMEKLQNSRVLLFGLGGVGGHAAEALARCGVGHLSLVDHDVVAPSNLNRQLIATRDTIGQKKVEVMAKRLYSIRPDISLSLYPVFYLPGSGKPSLDGYDYILDAIDTVSAKVALAKEAFIKNIPLISCMGTGGKLDPTRLEVADIFETSVCPLCRAMRQQLKKAGVPHLKVVYSKEPPAPRADVPEAEGDSQKRQTVGSVSFVPSVAGLILAGEVVRELTKGLRPVR
mgnify:CR=1 FL=1